MPEFSKEKIKTAAQKTWELTLNNKESLLLVFALLLAPTAAWWLVITPISSIFTFAQISLCIAQLLVSTNQHIAEPLGLSASAEDYQDNFYYFIIIQFACLLPLLAINRLATILNLVITLNHMPSLVSKSIGQNEGGQNEFNPKDLARAALQTNFLTAIRGIAQFGS